MVQLSKSIEAAVANHSGAMESRNHFKNGASLKSLTIRANVLRKAFFALLTTIITFCGCNKYEKGEDNFDNESVWLLDGIYEGGFVQSKFEYDEQDRLIKFSHCHAGKPSSTQIFTYNSSGELIKTVWGSPGAEEETAVEIMTFVKNGNRIIFNDNENNYLELDSKELPIKLVYKDDEGYFSSETTFQYDVKGNLVKKVHEQKSTDGAYNYKFTATYTYDNKKSPFFCCKTPKWYLISIKEFDIVNNICTHKIVGSNSGTRNLTYTYDKETGFSLTVKGRDRDYPKREETYKYNRKD